MNIIIAFNYDGKGTALAVSEGKLVKLKGANLEGMLTASSSPNNVIQQSNRRSGIVNIPARPTPNTFEEFNWWYRYVTKTPKHGTMEKTKHGVVNYRSSLNSLCRPIRVRFEEIFAYNLIEFREFKRRLNQNDEIKARNDRPTHLQDRSALNKLEQYIKWKAKNV